MATVAMSGSDTFTLNNHIFNDLADNNCVELTYPNEIAALKVGKSGNTIYALNESGKACDLKLRVVRGSADDQFLLGLLAQQQSNFAGFVLMIGQFVKKVGDGKGNTASDTYILSGGIFTKQIPGKDNVEGDTEQSISMYEFKFSNSPRTIA